MVDQIDPATGEFDEHKVMFGFLNDVAARQGYPVELRRAGRGRRITPMSLDEFKAWVFDKAKTKSRPAASSDAGCRPSQARVAQMTEEEMRRELLTDELTGLGNRRAYNEGIWNQKSKQNSMPIWMSMPSWVNDNMGHANGDELLKMMGEAIRQGVDTTSEDDGLSEATICQAMSSSSWPVYWHG